MRILSRILRFIGGLLVLLILILAFMISSAHFDPRDLFR